ncbi:MAG: thiol oxidoreductase [Polyangiaceae bacterium]|nr:thiol oxidoreductase [Polyangiaceae bacterium]
MGSRGTARSASVAALAALVSGACGSAEPRPEVGPAPRAGGDTTVASRSSNAFSFPAPALSDTELELHLAGDVAFEATFVTPPAVVNPGLGPLFNNDACLKCHVRDGRGLAVAGQGPLGSPLLVRVSVLEGEPELPGGPIPAPGLGTQLQDHAVYGAEPEATVRLEWIPRAGAYADGEPYELRSPRVTLTRPDGAPLPGEVLASPRIPPPVFGLGLLEAVPEASLLALADPDDADGDGISGRANRVWSVEAGEAVVGRFGWKANAPELRQQAAGAYAADMGVSSSVFPGPGGTVEVDEATLEAVVFYTRTLAVPARDAWDDPVVRRGEALFRGAGCARCHVETLSTGAHAVASLAHQTIHPYTDLLLHNMGFDLADARPDFDASGTEWRTPPLWGLGLSQTVLPYSTFLHDGRARTLEEAILWHGGEADASREAFRTAGATDRASLLEFLRSL